MDYPHRRVVMVRTSCSKQAVMYIVLSPLACHMMRWHTPNDDVGNPYNCLPLHPLLKGYKSGIIDVAQPLRLV
ncbi:MAG TPA: hypothetical protein VEL31_01440 [Ktedonobacteraceae bacterium]|nr:hypothetical protein [Ktedonobacteraceae bacterium]